MLTYINLHLSVQAIVEQKVVSHADSVGFHGMTLTIVIISNVTWNTVKHKISLMYPHAKLLQMNLSFCAKPTTWTFTLYYEKYIKRVFSGMF